MPVKVRNASPSASRREPRPFAPVMHLLGIALILFLVVGVFTSRNIRQTEESVVRLLDERGKMVIALFESSLRSDMRTRSGVRVQLLLEDLASRQDILFVALVQHDGEIVAHSDPTRVGQLLRVGGKSVTPEVMDSLCGPRADDAPPEESRVMRMEGHQAFVVHRTLFRLATMGVYESPVPLPGFPYQLYPRMPHSVMTPVQTMEIFVGQDTQPIREMQNQNMRNALFSGMLVLLTGLTAVVAMYSLERGAESRRRMRVAESLAQSMVEEVKRLEKEVTRREKMAAVGDLAAGVAHELRNPLSSIKGYAVYFSSRFPEGSEDRESARVLAQEVDRLNRVITDLIGVSRPTDIHPVPTDMGRLVEGTLMLLGADAAQRGVFLHREGESVEAWIDPDRFRQALLNVCLNAVEAMPEGGELHLRLSSNADWVMLDVVDNGPGIPADLLSRVFDPYFTTKSQGTGLGLATVLKIVEAHNGTVQIASEPGQGTTVHFSLPRRPPAGTPEAPGQKREPAQKDTAS